ncbi:hypothetical protein [Zoogloea sp.]|uniref:hypothetical protein n=1 Tax=Zoogloea sp. TaxID=49181 RepID=UPI00260A1676|nr:hypothetical protein [Zoogloea sp.]MDD3353924.1 hypothetical protein [Zoogloea sp.]
MAKPNYQFEKRQRDLAKKQKQEEKRREKLANKAANTSTPPADVPEDGVLQDKDGKDSGTASEE